MNELSGTDHELVGLLDESSLWPRREEPEVRREIVERFLPFAKSIAMRYSGEAEKLDDLIQIASLGLMNAVERFDPTREMPFLAFASPTIHGELKRHFRDRVGAVRMPRSLYERVGAMERVVNDLRAELHEEPTVDQLAEAMDCSKEQVEEARAAPRVRHPIALSGGEDDETPLGELLGLEDGGYLATEDRLLAGETIKALGRDDRVLLALRFREELSQAEIAKELDCSQMNVSRRLRRVLDKLHDEITEPVGSARS